VKLLAIAITIVGVIMIALTDSGDQTELWVSLSLELSLMSKSRPKELQLIDGHNNKREI